MLGADRLEMVHQEEKLLFRLVSRVTVDYDTRVIAHIIGSIGLYVRVIIVVIVVVVVVGNLLRRFGPNVRHVGRRQKAVQVVRRRRRSRGNRHRAVTLIVSRQLRAVVIHRGLVRHLNIIQRSLNGHFPRQPRSAGMSPFWILLELKTLCTTVAVFLKCSLLLLCKFSAKLRSFGHSARSSPFKTISGQSQQQSGNRHQTGDDQ